MMLEKALTNEVLADFLAMHDLSPAYLKTAKQHFEPLANTLKVRQQSLGRTLFVGINGSQGSGKTTLADYLVLALQSLGLSACAVSIDDFYYTKAQREQLAQRVHPLLRTRGVPGTHEVELAKQTLNALSQHGETLIPVFDKSVDDRRDNEHWRPVSSPVDIVLLEGWCVGITPQAAEALQTPMNALERENDKGGHWRQFVNDALRDDYAELWKRLDYWVMLKAPSFDCVFSWRLEQEEKLRQQTQHQENTALMSPAQIRDFIAHYERLTRHALGDLPKRCDVVFSLDKFRRIVVD